MYTGAPIAPTSARAKSKSTHSSLVEARIPNVSPLRTPSASRPFASSSTARSASAQETSRQPPFSSTRYAGRGRSCAVASCQSRPIVRSVSRLTAYVRSEEGKRTSAENPCSPGRIQGSPMRTIWNGSISFGLVNVPVGLAPATKPAARQSDIAFRTLHRECGTPIRQKRWCPVHEVDVEADEIVRGWEVSKGEFVIVEDADLEAIEQQSDSRTIDIARFVALNEVDPVYFDRTYILVPAGTAAARRPYVLLLEAMNERG